MTEYFDFGLPDLVTDYQSVMPKLSSTFIWNSKIDFEIFTQIPVFVTTSEEWLLYNFDKTAS